MRNDRIRELALVGDTYGSGAAGTAANITVMMRDAAGDIFIAAGTDVPADATSGYAKGCIFIDKNVATGTPGKYENIGTRTRCSFKASMTRASGVVSLEHLDSGVAPSDMTLYAGEISWAGSGATVITTVSGVAATDKVVGSIETAPTQAAYIKSITASTDTITTVLSAANTANDAVITYVVQRTAT
ncbi:MAG: hypothetical protein GY861_16740 [bacterium]|nr:hypothetical protein [bacterium]